MTKHCTKYCTKLSLNLNAVALLRNRRNLPWPDMLDLARIALRAGASGITVHPRPDQRHIRYADIAIISHFLKAEFPDAQFNIEGFPSPEFLNLAMPYANQITLVPDMPDQNTSDHGWDIAREMSALAPIIAKIKQADIAVSLFLEAGQDNMQGLCDAGVDAIELYTGPYAAYYNNAQAAKKQLELLAISARAARQCNLKINAGHDLTVQNIPALLEILEPVNEVSIGHALIAEALQHGMEQAVRRFLAAISTNVVGDTGIEPVTR